MISMLMPFPISLNSAFPTNRKTGGRFKSKAYKEWIAEADRWFARQRRMGAVTVPDRPLDGRLRLQICMNPKTARSYDLSNHIKIPEDRLKAWGIITDDSKFKNVQIVEDWWMREPERWTVSPGAIMVTVDRDPPPPGWVE